MATIIQTQLGKKGITKEFIEALQNHFKKRKMVRISVLKSCCRNKEELKEIVDKIVKELGGNFKTRTVGYTIILRKGKAKQ